MVDKNTEVESQITKQHLEKCLGKNVKHRVSAQPGVAFLCLTFPPRSYMCFIFLCRNFTFRSFGIPCTTHNEFQLTFVGVRPFWICKLKCTKCKAINQKESQPAVTRASHDCRKQKMWCMSITCLWSVGIMLPPERSTTNSLRERGHNFDCMSITISFFRQSFVANCLFKFLE